MEVLTSRLREKGIHPSNSSDVWLFSINPYLKTEQIGWSLHCMGTFIQYHTSSNSKISQGIAGVLKTKLLVSLFCRGLHKEELTRTTNTKSICGDINGNQSDLPNIVLNDNDQKMSSSRAVNPRQLCVLDAFLVLV